MKYELKFWIKFFVVTLVVTAIGTIIVSYLISGLFWALDMIFNYPGTTCITIVCALTAIAVVREIKITIKNS